MTTEVTTDLDGERRFLADLAASQASWRSEKAEQYDDARNTDCAEALEEFAAWVLQLPDGDDRIRRLADLHFGRPGDEGGGYWSETGNILARHGFNSAGSYDHDDLLDRVVDEEERLWAAFNEEHQT